MSGYSLSGASAEAIIDTVLNSKIQRFVSGSMVPSTSGSGMQSGGWWFGNANHPDVSSGVSNADDMGYHFWQEGSGADNNYFGTVGLSLGRASRVAALPWGYWALRTARGTDLSFGVGFCDGGTAQIDNILETPDSAIAYLIMAIDTKATRRNQSNLFVYHDDGTGAEQLVDTGIPAGTLATGVGVAFAWTGTGDTAEVAIVDTTTGIVEYSAEFASLIPNATASHTGNPTLLTSAQDSGGTFRLYNYGHWLGFQRLIQR